MVIFLTIMVTVVKMVTSLYVSSVEGVFKDGGTRWKPVPTLKGQGILVSEY